MEKSFIFDAHLDLAENALKMNRNLTWTVEEIRQSETGMTDKPDRGNSTVSLGALREGNVGLCVATQIARYVKPGSSLPGWHSPQQAWAHTQGQLAWYREMEALGELVQITNLQQLNEHLALWNSTAEDKPIGYILSLEGADSIVTIDHLQRSFEQGLRIIGPAHYGPGIYAQGTNATGGIGTKGKALLKAIERLNIILDASHLCDDSFWETMKLYNGPIWASHSNCRQLVPHNRQFSDEQLKELISRDAVIGTPLDAWMMTPNWIRGESTPKSMGVTLNKMVDHLDHICQLAGNSRHAGFGTDLDGGYGKEQCPADLNTIADLQTVPQLLAQRGYSTKDIDNITHKNFIRLLQNNWR